MMKPVEVEADERPRWVSILRILFTMIVCATVAGAILVRNAIKPRALPPPPLPVPNGHDDIVRAGLSIQDQVPNLGIFRTAKPEELKSWVAKNAEALKVGREGLKKHSRVAVVYEQDLSKGFENNSACRAFSRLLLAEAEIALIEKRPGDAARSYLDLLRLSEATGRGGLMIDAMTGFAVETQALNGLGRVREALPAEDASKALDTIRDVDVRRETWPEILNTEAYWAEKSVPWMIRATLRISGLEKKLRAPADAAFLKAHRRTQLTARRLLVAYANRLYEIDNQVEPDDPAQLVPKYLPELPKDPETGKPVTQIE